MWNKYLSFIDCGDKWGELFPRYLHLPVSSSATVWAWFCSHLSEFWGELISLILLPKLLGEFETCLSLSVAVVAAVSICSLRPRDSAAAGAEQGLQIARIPSRATNAAPISRVTAHNTNVTLSAARQDFPAVLLVAKDSYIDYWDVFVCSCSTGELDRIS